MIGVASRSVTETVHRIWQQAAAAAAESNRQSDIFAKRIDYLWAVNGMPRNMQLCGFEHIRQESLQ